MGFRKSMAAACRLRCLPVYLLALLKPPFYPLLAAGTDSSYWGSAILTYLHHGLKSAPQSFNAIQLLLFPTTLPVASILIRSPSIDIVGNQLIDDV
ncbi:hypothetical protein OH492_20585 [Vibrio chagasii]|nr:hypothetical protein [Vibrio chagasii]